MGYNMTQEPKLKGDSPTLWRDMTPEEKGTLLLAHHEGKDIEYAASASSYAGRTAWYGTYPAWEDGCAYRIKPEPKPKREVVRLAGSIDTSGNWSFYMDEVSHKITFDVIDGKPDPSSIKIEEV